MKRGALKLGLWVILIPLGYWGVTAAMIEHSARYLTKPRGGVVLIPFNHTKFLLSMGQRSVPALRRQITNPSVSLQDKIFIAWVLGRLGDFSHFHVFISGLESKRSMNQYLAAVQMADFPKECLRHLPAILLAGRHKQDGTYSGLLLFSLIHNSGLSATQQDALYDAIADLNSKPLTDGDVQKLLELFGKSTHAPNAMTDRATSLNVGDRSAALLQHS